MVNTNQKLEAEKQANGPQMPLACREPLTYGNTLARSLRLLLM